MRAISFSRVGWLLVGIAGAGAVGCGASGPKSGKGAATASQLPMVQQVAATACGRVKPGVGPSRVGEVRQGSTVALAETTEGGVRHLIAYIADSDEAALRTVDVTAGRELARTQLSGAAEQVMVLADGRVVASLRQAGLVEVLEPSASADGGLASRCVVSVPTEPIGLAVTPDETTVLVTSGWAHTLTGLDSSTFDTKLSADLPREPRSVVVTDDGKRAFVAHVVGAKMSVVDLADASKPRSVDLHMKQVMGAMTKSSGGSKLREGCQGFALAKAVTSEGEPVAPPPVSETPPVTRAPAPIAPKPVAPAPQTVPSKTPGRIFAPFVAVDPGDTSRATSGYGSSTTVSAEVSSVSVIDPQAERSMTRSLLVMPPRGQPTANRDCLLPRSAVHSGTSLFVTCLGIDSVLELDARSADPARAEARRWRVPAGPTGVAIDAKDRRAIVFSQFERVLSVIALDADSATDAAKRPIMISLSRGSNAGLTPELALGRVLFHKTGDPAISKDGRACASCHPDGREDALTWSTPDGPRQTMMLAGRLDRSTPFGWSGENTTVAAHVTQTMQRLEGTGLTPAHTAALVAYIQTMAAPKPSARSRDHAALAVRGKQLFDDPQSACATCHTGGGADGQRHDVNSRARSDKQGDFETPSLRFLGGTAPYFHDGRYATLVDLIEGSSGTMGHSAHFSREDRVALAAYLETL